MYIAKVLKRKDAASVLVAIAVGFELTQLISAVTARPAGLLLGLEKGENIYYGPAGAGFVSTYLLPLVAFILQMLVLEILIRIYAAAHKALSK